MPNENNFTNNRHHRFHTWHFRFDVFPALNQTKSGAAILQSCLRLPLPAPAELMLSPSPPTAFSWGIAADSLPNWRSNIGYLQSTHFARAP